MHDLIGVDPIEVFMPVTLPIIFRSKLQLLCCTLSLPLLIASFARSLKGTKKIQNKTTSSTQAGH